MAVKIFIEKKKKIFIGLLVFLWVWVPHGGWWGILVRSSGGGRHLGAGIGLQPSSEDSAGAERAVMGLPPGLEEAGMAGWRVEAGALAARRAPRGRLGAELRAGGGSKGLGGAGSGAKCEGGRMDGAGPGAGPKSG